MLWNSSPLYESTLGRIGIINSFLVTKYAVRRGLHKSQDTQSASKIMGPWQFNLTEVAIAGAPGFCLVSVWSFVAPEVPSEITAADVARYEARLQQLKEFVVPFAFALSFTLSAYIHAWFSLKPADRSRIKVNKAAQNFLYYDGAYGLTWKAVAGLFSAIYSMLTIEDVAIEGHPNSVNFAVLFGSILMLLYFSFFGWFLEVNRKVTRGLLISNGYELHQVEFLALKLLIFPALIVLIFGGVTWSFTMDALSYVVNSIN